MSAPISPETRNTDTMMKLFSEAIARLRLITIKGLILASLLVAVLVTLSAPLQAGEPLPLDEPGARPADTFVILLSGPYKPVTDKPVMDCPNFGLLQVNVCDGSYSTTKIYRVSGLPEEPSARANRGNRPGDGNRERRPRSGTFTYSSMA